MPLLSQIQKHQNQISFAPKNKVTAQNSGRQQMKIYFDYVSSKKMALIEIRKDEDSEVKKRDRLIL